MDTKAFSLIALVYISVSITSCSLYRDTFQRSNDITPLQDRSLTPEIVCPDPTPSANLTPLPSATPASATTYEIAENYSSASIIKSLSKGDHYVVEEPVTYDGLNYYFIINSDFGKFEAYGLEEFKERLSELPGIFKLYKISTLAHVGLKAGEGIIAPFEAAGHLVLHPISSAQKVPTALQNLYDKAADFLSRAEHTTEKAYAAVLGPSDEEIAKKQREEEERAKKEIEERKKNKDSHEDKQNRTQKREELTIQATEFAKDYTDDYIGYAVAKRELAKSVNVDPYSPNPFVQRELVRLSSWQAAGRLTMKFVPLPSVPAINISAKIDSILWDVDERSLVEASFKELSDVGIPAVNIRKLLANKEFTRSQMVKLTQALAQIGDIEGINEYVLLLSATASPSVARYYLNVTNYFVQLKSKKELKAISTNLEVPLALSNSGSSIIIAPFDRIAWIAPIDAYTNAVANWSKNKKLRVKLFYSGSLSKRTKKELKKRKIIFTKITLPKEAPAPPKEANQNSSSDKSTTASPTSATSSSSSSSTASEQSTASEISINN